MKTLVECPLIRPKGSRFAPRRSKECHWETDFCRMEVAYRHAERRSSIEFVGHDPEHAATGLTGILYRLALSQDLQRANKLVITREGFIPPVKMLDSCCRRAIPRASGS